MVHAKSCDLWQYGLRGDLLAVKSGYTIVGGEVRFTPQPHDTDSDANTSSSPLSEPV